MLPVQASYIKQRARSIWPCVWLGPMKHIWRLSHVASVSRALTEISEKFQRRLLRLTAELARLAARSIRSDPFVIGMRQLFKGCDIFVDGHTRMFAVANKKVAELQ